MQGRPIIGSAYNVVPDTATLAGTIRYFKDEIYDLAAERMQRLCDGFAMVHDAEVRPDLRNDADLSDAYIEAAEDIVGADNIKHDVQPVTGPEDFFDMLKTVPGAYCVVGHAGTVPLHNPGFALDTGILPVGASVMARIVERRLAAGSSAAI